MRQSQSVLSLVLVTLMLIFSTNADAQTVVTDTTYDWAIEPQVVWSTTTSTMIGQFTVLKETKTLAGLEECKSTIFQEFCFPFGQVVEVCLPVFTSNGLYMLYLPAVFATAIYDFLEVDCSSTFYSKTLYECCYTVDVSYDSSFGGSGASENEAIGSLPAKVILTHFDVEPVFFDGEPFAAGTEIALYEQDLGNHLLTYVRNSPSGPETHTLTLQVTSSYTTRQVDSDPGLSTLPSAVFEFTNDSSDAVDVHFEVSTPSDGLNAYLSNNRASVAPGATVQRTVRFDTVSGYALGDGLPACADVTVHTVGASGPVISSAAVQACSYTTVQGTDEDLALESVVEDVDLPRLCNKFAFVGDSLNVRLDSPGGSLVGESAAIYFDLFHPFTGITRALPSIPELHMSAAALPLTPAAPLPAAGIEYTTVLGPAFQGSALRVQGMVFTSSAANGVVVLTDAHDILVY